MQKLYVKVDQKNQLNEKNTQIYLKIKMRVK